MPVGLKKHVLTDEELCQRFLINGPLFIADSRLKGSIYRLEVYSCRYNLAGLDGFGGRRRSTDSDSLGGEDGC